MSVNFFLDLRGIVSVERGHDLSAHVIFAIGEVRLGNTFSASQGVGYEMAVDLKGAPGALLLDL